MQIATDSNQTRTVWPGLLPVLLTAGLLTTLTISLTSNNSHAQPQNQAQPEDNDRKIMIDADLFNSKIEGQVRVTTFTTNVRVTQGTMEILGDVAVTLTSPDSNALEKVTVYGHPARFKQLSADSGQLTEGDSDTIVFDTNNQGETRIITLTGEVKITQQFNEISGDNAVLLENLTSHNIEKVTVLGQPARYFQLAENTGDRTEGSGDSIYYTSTDETVVEFVGNAELTQPNSYMSCATVTYSPDGERVSSTGPCRGVLNQTER